VAVTQDVTVWITLGALTIPHAEDVPTIQTPGSQMSFVLQPFNYFDSDPSQFVDDAVTVHGAGGSTLVYRRHGDAASRGRRQLDCVPVMVRKSAAAAAVGRLSRGVVAFTAMMVATAARSSSC